MMLSAPPTCLPKIKHVPAKCLPGTPFLHISRKFCSTDGPDCRLHRHSSWRKEPATSDQKGFIAKRWDLTMSQAMIGRNVEFQQRDKEFKTLTKGAAEVIILRLTHGTAVRFSWFDILKCLLCEINHA